MLIPANESNMIHGRRCGQALLMLLFASIVCGCASDMRRNGTDAANLSSVYVGMPRSNFEDLLGQPIEKGQTREYILATYKYDRGYTGCVEAARCPEIQGNKTTETLVAIGTLGVSEIVSWYEINKCQVGYLDAKYGPDSRLINLRILDPDTYKGRSYMWNKEEYDPEPWYPCREIYHHPKPLTIPAAVMDNNVFSKAPE